MKWIIQDTLIDVENALKMKRACDELGIEAIGAGLVPFQDKLELPPDKYIFYGSTKLAKLAAEGYYGPGLWSASVTTPLMVAKMLGNFALNKIIIVTNLRYMKTKPKTFKGPFFVKPSVAEKLFAGGPVSCINDLEQKLLNSGAPKDEVHTLSLIISPVKEIMHEYRFLVIEGSVTCGSAYRLDGIRKDSTNIPHHAWRFAQVVAKQWIPEPVIMMDICESRGKLHVLEYNCFNSSGLYAMNHQYVVKRVHDYAVRADRMAV